jgi:hypothetical protein
MEVGQDSRAGLNQAGPILPYGHVFIGSCQRRDSDYPSKWMKHKKSFTGMALLPKSHQLEDNCFVTRR